MYWAAIDQHGQIIDVLVSARRDVVAARRFFTRALATLKVVPVEVVTDAPQPSTPWCSPICCRPRGITLSSMRTILSRPDHSWLKHQLRPIRGLRTDRSAQIVITGHAFVQNLRRGHYEIVTVTPGMVFTELVTAL